MFPWNYLHLSNCTYLQIQRLLLLESFIVLEATEFEKVCLKLSNKFDQEVSDWKHLISHNIPKDRPETGFPSNLGIFIHISIYPLQHISLKKFKLSNLLKTGTQCLRESWQLSSTLTHTTIWILRSNKEWRIKHVWCSKAKQKHNLLLVMGKNKVHIISYIICTTTSYEFWKFNSSW